MRARDREARARAGPEKGGTPVWMAASSRATRRGDSLSPGPAHRPRSAERFGERRPLVILLTDEIEAHVQATIGAVCAYSCISVGRQAVAASAARRAYPPRCGTSSIQPPRVIRRAGRPIRWVWAHQRDAPDRWRLTYANVRVALPVYLAIRDRCSTPRGEQAMTPLPLSARFASPRRLATDAVTDLQSLVGLDG